MGNVLRSGYSLSTITDPFPGLWPNSATYDPQVDTGVVLPNGQQYQFKYNNYGEIARVDLPTGAATEYDPVAGSGVISGNNGYGDVPAIYRRVGERRVYADGATLTSRTAYTTTDSNNYPDTTNSTTEQTYDASSNLLAKATHFFGTSPSASLIPPADTFNIPVLNYPAYYEGRETQTDVYDTNGTTVLRRTLNTYQAGGTLGGFSINGRVSETDSIIEPSTSNLYAKTAFSYDSYNNVTDTYQYDFGTGGAGPFLKR
ncbi:MAG: hypothetical protein JO314_08110, partial [Acidobacteria bacterium]|nr:hypothetical protein [Acidobacteriota bacterium]